MTGALRAKPSFDPARAPLVGTVFIEASAGTGKTHALVSLYLRLIAERGLSPSEILVVTFTNAATAELRSRVRARLREALAVEMDPERGARLRRGLRDFDQAAIFTIHGFCQRTLQESAFESAQSFETELVEKPERLQRTLAHDLASRLLEGEDEGFREWLAVGKGKRWEFEPEKLYGWMKSLLGADEKMPVLPGDDVLEAIAAIDTRALTEAADRAWNAFARAFRGHWAELEALLVDPSTPLNRRYYKEETACGSWREKLGQACDAFEQSTSPTLRAAIDPPECVGKYLTLDAIRSYTTQKKPSPEHPFFSLASDLVQASASLSSAFDQKAVALRRRFVDEVRAAAKTRREARHVLFFDDLLVGMRSALQGEGGESLAAVLRQRYRVALIDEFQDTDDVQYAIFEQIWHAEPVARAEGGLFLIGDPKQAIYSFRGADLATYLAARRDAGESVHSLSVNHRSEPAMIDAVNAVFSASRDPFAFEEVPFEMATPARRDDRPVYRADARFAAGLRIALHASDEDDEESDAEGSSEEALRVGRTRFAQAMARDVAELLESKATIDGRPIAPSDVAILARRKSELDAARRALEAIGIPCVSRGSGDVFDSREAWELASVLAAWLHPGDSRRLRAALSTGAHGWNARALATLGDDAPELAAVAERFAEYGRIWARHGFARAFAAWKVREDVAEGLTRHADGDRRLTNWLHVAELLARVEAERGTSRTGLAAWLDRAVADEAVREELGEEATLLRLERDDEAVQLVTLHLSKGLEYEIVYLPFLWETFETKETKAGEVKEKGQRPPIRFHDSKTGRRTLDLGADHATYNQHRALFKSEAEAEHRRLLYVGLTRARRLCVVHWGRFGEEYARSPLARLLLGERARAESIAPPELAAWAKKQPDAVWNAAWQALADAAPVGAIRIEPALLGEGEGERWQPSDCAPITLAPIEPVRPLALRAIATTSFSALVRGADGAGIGSIGPLATGRDLDAEQIAPTPPAERVVTPTAGLAGDMHLFPRGAEAGTLLHEVLERVDLAACDLSAIRALAREWIERSGLTVDWIDHVVHVVTCVARTPLRSDPRPLRLGALAPGQLLAELEFTLAAPGEAPGRGFSPDALARILADAAPGSALARYAERVAALAWPELDGYLRGFIDAVFFDGERYFLIDYKSNHLGVQPGDYLPERLISPMIEHDYVLQYLLYTVALDRHLASRLADYDYERHFGGAYYLFLRGLSEAHPAGCGVFFDRPEAAIVARVSRLLGSVGGEAR